MNLLNLFQLETTFVALVFILKCIIVVESLFLNHHPYENDERQQIADRRIVIGSKEPRVINRSLLAGYRGRPGNKMRQRFRYPWRSRITKFATIKANPDICRNHSRVNRVEDEPGPVVCLRKSEHDLLVQLGSTGGLNKRYAAVNITDASGFEDLTTFPEGQPKTPDHDPKKTEVMNLTESTKHHAPMRQADKEEFDLKKQQRLKRSLPTSPGTFFRGCQKRGTITKGTNLHRLCTECSATTRLSDDRFPKYINEVICRDSDHQCAANMGLCFQRTHQLDFLRFTGKFAPDIKMTNFAGKPVYKEVWDFYTQEIRSCCECEMYPHIYRAIKSRNGGDDGDDGDDDGDDDDDDDDDDR